MFGCKDLVLYNCGMNKPDTSRSTALGEAIADAQIDATTSGEQVVMACVGQPWCYLLNEEAQAEQAKDCPLCDRYIIERDGSWVVDRSQGISPWGNS